MRYKTINVMENEIASSIESNESQGWTFHSFVNRAGTFILLFTQSADEMKPNAIAYQEGIDIQQVNQGIPVVNHDNLKVNDMQELPSDVTSKSIIEQTVQSDKPVTKRKWHRIKHRKVK